MTDLAHAYEEIAPEYYDAVRHPTSANFREASARVLVEVLPDLVAPDSVVAEVGCGDSLLMEVLTDRGVLVRSVTLTDSSPTMLLYSERWQRPGVELRLADAENLPFENGGLDLLVSILGDPYNTDRFWREVSRVLGPDGHAVFTAPSHEWSMAYRGNADRAIFDRSTEPDLMVRSFVLAPNAQRMRIEEAGLSLQRQIDVPLALIRGPISPKLEVLGSPESVVVNGYIAVKGPA